MSKVRDEFLGGDRQLLFQPIDHCPVIVAWQIAGLNRRNKTPFRRQRKNDALARMPKLAQL